LAVGALGLVEAERAVVDAGDADLALLAEAFGAGRLADAFG
jgi:hypothetical protein